MIITFDFVHSNVIDMDFRTFADLVSKVIGVGICLWIIGFLMFYPCLRSSLNTDLINQMKQETAGSRPSQFVKGLGGSANNYLENMKMRLSYSGLNNLHTKINESLHLMRVLEREGTKGTGASGETDKDYQISKLRMDL